MLEMIGKLIGGTIKTILVLALVALVVIVVAVVIISKMTIIDMIQFRMSMEMVPMKIAEFINIMGL